MEFTKRLERIFEYYELTASSFADRIQVQRSTISHLLSGRNKPSLDFVMKVVEEFPEVELFWLVDGKGVFPKSTSTLSENKMVLNTEVNLESNDNQINLFESIEEIKSEEKKLNTNNLNQEIIKTEVISSDTLKKETIQQNIISEDSIESIVIFYNDGSFKKYKSRN